MHIGDICTRSVVTCRRDASVLELAQLMRDHHVGEVIVVDEREGKMTPVGVVTDRDLVVGGSDARRGGALTPPAPDGARARTRRVSPRLSR